MMIDSSVQATGIRLQKVLASAGVGSRRACEELIDEGRVAAAGTPEEVLTPEHLLKAFHVRPIAVRNPAGGGLHLIFE